MWRLDAIGISECIGTSFVEHPTMLEFENEIIKVNNRYEVPLMIKSPGLGTDNDNRSIAENRLFVQLRRFRTHPEMLEQYDRTIREYFDEGHMRRKLYPQRRDQKTFTICHIVLSFARIL